MLASLSIVVIDLLRSLPQISRLGLSYEGRRIFKCHNWVYLLDGFWTGSSWNNYYRWPLEHESFYGLVQLLFPSTLHNRDRHSCVVLKCQSHSTQEECCYYLQG
jgi:hypothetical protein